MRSEELQGKNEHLQKKLEAFESHEATGDGEESTAVIRVTCGGWRRS